MQLRLLAMAPASIIAVQTQTSMSVEFQCWYVELRIGPSAQIEGTCFAAHTLMHCATLDSEASGSNLVNVFKRWPFTAVCRVQHQSRQQTTMDGKKVDQVWAAGEVVVA